MTKVTILGEEPQKKELKPIEFVLQASGKLTQKELIQAQVKPDKFDFIELICKSYDTDLYYDIMFAYDNDSRDTGVVFFGYFNDGIV